MKRKIRVLVVDDSAYMRLKLKDIIEEDHDLEVVGIARDGQDALKKIDKLKPDVITLDLIMQGMSGIETLDYIMEHQPIPVLIVSAISKPEAMETFEALDHGAVDFIPKPSGVISLDIHTVAEELRKKVKNASKIDIKAVAHKILSPKPPPPEPEISPFLLGKIKKVVAIASSTGGPRALATIMPMFPENLPASILIVQHMMAGFTDTFSERLNRMSKLKVGLAKDRDEIQPSAALVAPGGYHMRVESCEGCAGLVRLDRDSSSASSGPCSGLRPCADIMMKSVASLYGLNAIGVVLTGMGSDGTQGLNNIRGTGGITIAEDKSTALIYGMPKSAIEKGVVDRVVPLHKIPHVIMELVEGKI